MQPAEEDVAGGLHQPLPGRRRARRGSRTRSGRGTPRAPRPRPPSSAGTAGPRRRGRAAARSRRACRRCRRRRPCARSRRAGTPRAARAGRARASRGSARSSSCSAVEDLVALRRPAARSSIGTISGGSATIRGSPSTHARQLGERRHAVLACAPWRACFSVRLTCFGLELRARTRSSALLDVEVRVPDVEVRSSPAKLAHRRRGTRATVSSTICSWSLTAKPLSRAAISMLAASRLTSHSHGPGSVSSKSLTSNTSRRSGEANTPKFDRCASPQHCTRQPRARRRRQVAGHDQRRAAVERERRDEHPPVADRHELRHARLGLALEQLDRIGAVRRAARTRRGSSAAPPRAPPCRAPPARPPSDAGRSSAATSAEPTPADDAPAQQQLDAQSSWSCRDPRGSARAAFIPLG